jgi:hypothetical protein
MVVAQAPTSLELAPGRLHALGGVVPVDGRISWFAESARGYTPLLCYLLTDDTGDLILDTSLPLLRDQIVGQLAALHPADKPLAMMLSRNPEFDSIGNAGIILTRFRTQRLISIFQAEPWLYWQPNSGALPPDDRPADMVPEWIEIKREMEIPVGPGGRTLKVLGAPLRLLSTFWGYDAATRTLFTSDAFGHNLLAAPDDSWIVDAGNDTATHEQVRDHMLGKFDWLAHAHTEKLCDQLRELFTTYDVERIAPQFGRIIEGRDTVARHLGLVLSALEEVGV